MKPSMEEVWGNISLPSLHNPAPTTKPPNLAAFNSVGGGTSFYDFFNNKDPYSDQQSLSNFSKTNSLSNINQMGFVQNPSSSPLARKRPPNNGDDESANDRRRQRLIKNRESADRSRARRQAYTNELEQKIENLKKENAALRHQLEKDKPEKVGIIEAAATTKTKTAAAAAAAAQQLKSSKGNSLYRTLTAPF